MKKIFISLFFIIFFCFSCSSPLTTETYTIYSMNTVINITFYNTKKTNEIIKDIEKIYLKYNNVASDYSTGYGNKSVYDLNKERTITGSPELIEIIEFSLDMKEETNGYFEPLLGTLSKSWKEALSKGKLLEEDYIKEQLNIISNSRLVIEGNVVSIIGDANLDLGGIAKGYATQKVKEYLDSNEIDNYMLNAGQSNIVLGTKMNEKFNVGFKCPFSSDYYNILELSNVSIGTSSMEHQHSLIDGVYYSHLLNPKTGYPATIYESISIFGENSAILDAYSTACFAMELDEAKEFLSEKGYEWMACSDGKLLYESKGVNHE